ncbi:MAG: M48 family metallopeptidase [Spirochaetota bacterium]|nr:M48 family metallopeptidase [Spirochaetota bacterium]
MKTNEPVSNIIKKEEDVKTYNRIKIIINIFDLVFNIIFITLLAFSGISQYILGHIEVYSQNPYIQFLLFLFVVGLIAALIDFPIDLYSSYFLEHRYGLSNQNIFNWLIERMKSLIVGVSLGIPVSLIFYYLLRISGDNWWLFFGIFVFIFAILLARIAPILIFPIFYKYKQLDNDALKERIFGIIKKYNIGIKGIYTFDMSKDTKKANAGFTGIGKSKRIIISDTLIDNFTLDEIEIIFAHELGHYIKRHIVKSIFFSGTIIFLSFYICGILYSKTISIYGLDHSYDIAAIPILFFYLSLFSLVLMPITNIISRRFEREADLFAIQLIGKNEPFISSMERLAELNLTDKEPNKIIEFLFYSHPSIKKRIEFGRNVII